MPPRKRQTVAELRALQQLTARAVMRPLAPGMRMRPRWSDGRAMNEVAGEFIKPNDRLNSFERLEIYNRQYWFRLLDCFYEDYPGLRTVLGNKRFADLAVAYLANHPSTSFTLRDLGQSLVKFIRDEPRWTMPRQEIALAMARLEWAHIVAFDGAERKPFSANDLRGRDPAKIKLRLQPHITLLELAWPLDDFLIGLRDNLRLRGEASNAVENSAVHAASSGARLPQPRAVRLAVHRHRNIVYYKRLKRGQFEMLTALQRGASLREALEEAQDVSQVRAWFQDWSALGWFYTGREK